MSQSEQYIDTSNQIDQLEKEIKQLRSIIDVLRTSLLQERVSEYDNT